MMQDQSQNVSLGNVIHSLPQLLSVQSDVMSLLASTLPTSTESTRKTKVRSRKEICELNKWCLQSVYKLRMRAYVKDIGSCLHRIKTVSWNSLSLFGISMSSAWWMCNVWMCSPMGEKTSEITHPSTCTHSHKASPVQCENCHTGPDEGSIYSTFLSPTMESHGYRLHLVLPPRQVSFLSAYH